MLLRRNTIYIPAGCTDELQPLDVSVNKLFKDYYRQYMDSNPMPYFRTVSIVLRHSWLSPLEVLFPHMDDLPPSGSSTSLHDFTCGQYH